MSYEKLQAKIAGKNNSCPVCGSNGWTPAAENQHLMLQVVEEDGVNLGTGLDVLPLVCQGCGYVRLHAIQAL